MTADLTPLELIEWAWIVLAPVVLYLLRRIRETEQDVAEFKVHVAEEYAGKQHMTVAITAAVAPIVKGLDRLHQDVRDFRNLYLKRERDE